jgi:predicted O-methyltransferase YrrM
LVPDPLQLRVRRLFGKARMSGRLAGPIERGRRLARRYQPLKSFQALRMVDQVTKSGREYYFPPWHGDELLASLVDEAVTKLGVSCFVETGTFVGDTTRYMALRHRGMRILTCEIDPVYAEVARRLLGPRTDVKILEEASVSFLEEIQEEVAQTLPLVWLDAHWGTELPLRKECSIIAKLPRYVALVDDFQVPGRPFRYDSYGDAVISLGLVSDYLGKSCYVPNYDPLVLDYSEDYVPVGYGLFFKNVDQTSLTCLKNLELLTLS